MRGWRGTVGRGVGGLGVDRDGFEGRVGVSSLTSCVVVDIAVFRMNGDRRSVMPPAGISDHIAPVIHGPPLLHPFEHYGPVFLRTISYRSNPGT
jgi:hypothetical protein